MCSVVVAHGLSCSKACGISSDWEANLCPLHWQADSYPLCHQGSPWLLLCRAIRLPLSNSHNSSLKINILLASVLSNSVVSYLWGFCWCIFYFIFFLVYLLIMKLQAPLNLNNFHFSVLWNLRLDSQEARCKLQFCFVPLFIYIASSSKNFEFKMFGGECKSPCKLTQFSLL